MRRPETRAAYAFISPWILGFVFFTAGPVLATLVLSMTEYDVLTRPEWIGFDNYRDAMANPDTGHALKNTATYALMYVPASMALGLALALLLQRAGRATGLMRTLMYLPVMTPPVATAVLFLLLLNGQNGLVNEVLGSVGLPTPYWTSDPDWMKTGIVILSLWSVGSVTIILYAALQEVPEALIEAARIDGAGALRRFWHVTLPMVSPALLFTTVVATIASMQLFTEAYTMYFGTASTNASDEVLFYVIYLFREAFSFFHMGYASALAWMLFLVILAITMAQLWLSRRLVFYRSD